MPLTPTQLRYAEALQVEKLYGDRAPLYVAEQIGRLIEENDMEGVERWRQIAGCLDRIRRGTVQ